MELDFWQLLRLARRWWWLLVLGPIVGAAMAFVVGTQGTSDFTAAVLLRISPVQISNLIVYDDDYTGETLAATYRLLVWTPEVLNPVIEDLGLQETPASLGEKISAYQIQGTQLVRVSVTDQDPAKAATIANAIATSLSARVVEEIDALNSTARVTLEQQIADTERQITEATQQIQALESSPSAQSPAVQAEVGTLETAIDRLEDSRTRLLTTVQDLNLDAAVTTQQISIASPAAPPVPTQGTDVPLMLMTFGAVAGFLVGASVITALSYLDRSVRAGADFVTLTGSPQLAAIPNESKLREADGNLVLLEHPNSAAAEAIRLLRVNLDFATAGNPITSLAISSPGSGEGKSTIAANLAAALAQTEVRTVLIDADLREPAQHEIFGVANTRGLVSWLTRENESWESLAVRTSVPGLELIPSGPPPPNPADMLSRNGFKRLIDEITASGATVILDTPALEAGSDALVVAANVSNILLIARAGQTKRDALHWAAAALRPSGARIVGVVLNRESEERASRRGYAPDPEQMREEVPALVTAGAESSRR